MSIVDANQPEGTPTWVDLGIPDLDRAMAFYRAVFGWQFQVGPEEVGRYTMCLLHDRPVAAIMPHQDPDASEFWWQVYFATDDCDRTARRITEAGGVIADEPMEVMDQGRMATARDSVGASFALWQGRVHPGAQVVSEPGALVRNDLVTADPEAARRFYPAIFDFMLDRSLELPDQDFTFLRRPDGHEVAGIMGVAEARSSGWLTTFEVADADAAVAAARSSGGAAGQVVEMAYGRTAAVKDPFAVEFSIVEREQGVAS